MRYAYQRILEEVPGKEIYQDVKNKFSLNAWYRKSGIERAKNQYAISKEKNPEKVVFGGKINLIRRKDGKISNQEWKNLRNNQLYCRGAKNKKGNANLRFVEEDGGLYLRVATEPYKKMKIKATIAKHKGLFLSGETAYNVRVVRKGGRYFIHANFKESFETVVGFRSGSIGLDFNHKSIDLSVVNKQGQLKTTRTFVCPELTTSRTDKSLNQIREYANKIIDFCKYRQKGLVVEDLKFSNSNHLFTYREFLLALERRAIKEGVGIRKVNPAYTSVLGKLKYAPYYKISTHLSAALVIARRGLGFSERLGKLKTKFFKSMEEREDYLESLANHRFHSWSLLRMMKNLSSGKQTNFKHSNQEVLGPD